MTYKIINKTEKMAYFAFFWKKNERLSRPPGELIVKPFSEEELPAICETGTEMCYAAWTPDQKFYWGIGPDGRRPCKSVSGYIVSCCFICKTTTEPLQIILAD